jgi:hypothetical protein
MRRESAGQGAAAGSGLSAASSAELASYIETMSRELEKLARSRGLRRLGDLLHLASGEARRARGR